MAASESFGKRRPLEAAPNTLAGSAEGALAQRLRLHVRSSLVRKQDRDTRPRNSSVPLGRLVKTTGSTAPDKTVKLWNLATNKERVTLEGHTESVMSVVFSPDGKILASASRDKTVKLWDVATGKERATLHGHEGMVYSVAFTPDGKTLASVSGDKTVRLWDVATGK
ncbi:MAG: hypothetical protein U0793_05185 [Gemmataceae bacterium]